MWWNSLMKKQTQLKNEQNIWTDTSPKKTHKWQVSALKDVHQVWKYLKCGKLRRHSENDRAIAKEGGAGVKGPQWQSGDNWNSQINSGSIRS